MSDKTNKTETEETVKTKKNQLTPEELEKRREDGIEFYDKQCELLEAQLKYETIKADLQEQKTRGTLSLAQEMSMYQQPKPEGDDLLKSDESPNKEERKLAAKQP